MPSTGRGKAGIIATYRNAVLIYNPCAGRLRGRRGALVHRVLETLARGGHRVSAVPTKASGEATTIAREAAAARADLVLALGGDGTLNEIVNGLVYTDVPVAHLPAGTANVLSREVGVGCDALNVARGLADLKPHRVASGLLHAEPGPSSRHFLLMAGVGFDAHIVYNLSLPLKSRVGQAAYWVGAAKELVRRQDLFETRVNGHVYTCSFALSSRVRNYAGWMTIAREASLHGDDFQVVLCEGTSTVRDYGRYLTAVLAGRATNARGMRFLRAREVEFTAPPDSRVYVQIDGEYAGRLPARVEVVPSAVTILAPPRVSER